MNDPLSDQFISSNNAENAAGPRVLGTQLPAHEPAATHSPHIVIRGESTTLESQTIESLALIDWLSFTIYSDSSHATLTYLEKYLENLFQISPSMWTPAKSGWHGYKNRINFGQFGFVAYGGESQKDTFHVSIAGSGCKNIDDWSIVRLIGEEENWLIKRLDLAHDDFHAKYIDVDRALQWYEEGLFTSSGRPPKRRLIDDFDTGEGKTFYVGNRSNGKLLRIYEKGKQLGDKTSPWVRAELELRAKDRVIPWDALTEPETYLSGSFKALSYLSEKQSRLKTTQREATTKYETMKRWLRMAGGKALNTMLQVEQGDISAVFEQIVRDGYPSRLSDLSDYLPAAVVKDQ